MIEKFGATVRGVYVAAARAARSVAQRAGLLDRLDRRYQARPSGPAAHLRTLFAIHDIDDLVSLDIPWWTYRAIQIVERRLIELDGEARVFEYGSGASTVWLGNRSREVHSVEHHAGFANVMRRVLAQAGLTDKVELLEIAAETLTDPVTPSRRKGENHVDYTAYSQAIKQVGGLFDIIVVDGRARVACCMASLPHLAPGGLIVLDDAQRPRYHEGIQRSGLPVRRIWGWVPSLPYPRQTALPGPR